MANSSGPVTLPAGYTLEQPQAPATPPPGYTVEGSTSGGNGSGVLSTLKSVAQAPGDIMKGAAQEAIESAGETISALPFLGKHLISPESLAAERAAFAPKSIAEKGGQIIGGVEEPILEFVLGDEALKGLSLAERIGIAGKIAKIAQESPYIGKLLEHGVSAARQGLVAGLQEGEHTGSVSKGIAAGAGVAGTSAVLGAAGTAASKIADLTSTAKSAPSAVRGAAEATATKAGVTPASSTSIRQTIGNLADAVESKAKSLYAQLDQAAGGQSFQRYLDQTKAIHQQMRSATTDEAFDKLSDQLETAEANHLKQVQAMKAAGKVDPATYDQAKDLWKQKSKLEKLDFQVNASTSGMTGVTPKAEKLDPSKLAPRLIKLYQTGDLQTALGGNAEAAKLIHDVASSSDAAMTKKTLGTILKWALSGLGAGTLGGVGFEVVKHSTE